MPSPIKNSSRRFNIRNGSMNDGSSGEGSKDDTDDTENLPVAKSYNGTRNAGGL